MSSGTGHLSFFALDGLRLGRSPSPGEQLHLAGCAACAGYLRQADEPEHLARPAWLHRAGRVTSTSTTTSTGPTTSRLWWTRPWLLLPLVPAIGLLLLLVGPQADTPAPVLPPPPGDGIREKAASPLGPAVRVFIKRGDQVFAWDGRTDLHPADRLRLELRPAGYQFVSVGARSASGAPPVVLYEGPLERQRALLPVSFRVDAQGADEVLSVILAREPVPPRLHAQADAPADEARTWRQIIVLPKQPAAAPAAPSRADTRGSTP